MLVAKYFRKNQNFFWRKSKKFNDNVTSKCLFQLQNFEKSMRKCALRTMNWKNKVDIPPNVFEFHVWLCNINNSMCTVATMYTGILYLLPSLAQFNFYWQKKCQKYCQFCKQKISPIHVLDLPFYCSTVYKNGCTDRNQNSSLKSLSVPW